MTISRSARVLVLLLAALAGGCQTPAQYREEKRQVVLKAFPPGMNREDALKKMSEGRGVRFEQTFVRPANGWQPGMIEYAQASEQRTGKPVFRADRCITFGMLQVCFFWLYYDEQDRVADADWVTCD